MAEDQTKPISPHPGGGRDMGSASGGNSVDYSASRRIRPGTKAADIAEGPPLVELSEIDSAFQLTEHIKALHYSFTNPSISSTIRPLSTQQALELAQPPPGVDRQIWLYELCRFLVMKTNTVITHLFAEYPPCSAQTCPEMRASEWQYLCAVHNPPKPCCAIDYCCHTLDWAANSVTSPKDFASRLSLGGEGGVLAQQVKTITNIMRRVYRIFAHAWFSHREMFWKIESKEGLYVFFKTVCDTYNLIPEDNYTIPPEAEGKEPTEMPRDAMIAPAPQASAPAAILRRAEPRLSLDTDEPQISSASTVLPPGATARRHRHTPSTGAAVESVMEEPEEDEDGQFSVAQTPSNTPLSPQSAAASLPFRSNPRPDTQVYLERSTTSFVSPSHPSQRSEPVLSNSPPSSPTSAFPIPSDSSLQSSPGLQADLTISDFSPNATPEEQARIVPITTRPFSPFSPASPKAATVEEMQEEREKQQEERAGSSADPNAMAGESNTEETDDPASGMGGGAVGASASAEDRAEAREDAKTNATAGEAQVAGETGAAEGDEATKSVGD